MKWSAQRQFAYAASLIFTVIAVAAFFIIRNQSQIVPTCFDGEKNQDERGVDCGGVCTKMCLADVEDIKILWARALPVTDKTHHVVGYVENRNLSAGVEEIYYRFRIYDSNNVLIGERVSSTFIEPNQRIALFEPHFEFGDREPSRVFLDFSWQGVDWQRTDSEFSKPLIIVESTQVETDRRAPRVRARVWNSHDKTFRDVEFIAIVYDVQGNALASSKTVIPRFTHGERKEIFFTWNEEFKENAARVEVVTRLNPFK